MKNTLPRILVAATTLAALCTPIDAAIVYSNSTLFSVTGDAIPSACIPIPNFSGIFDIVQYGGYRDEDMGDSPSDGFLDGANPGQGALCTNVNLGDVVSSLTSGWAGQTHISNDGTHYFGISFDNAGTTNYGWMEVTTSNYGNFSSSPNFTLVAYAYEDTGASITVGEIGAIPEPSAFALLGLGFVGLAARRRRVA